jgi:hypothetical protein
LEQFDKTLLKAKTHDEPYIKKFAEKLLSSFDVRWEKKDQFNRDVFYVIEYLDPLKLTKDEYFIEGSMDSGVKLIQTKGLGLYLSISGQEDKKDSLKKRLNIELTEFQRKIGKFSNKDSNEYSRYWDLIKLQHRDCIVAQIATIYSEITCSNGGVESSFSTQKRMMRDTRTRLKTDQLNKEMSVAINYRVYFDE